MPARTAQVEPRYLTVPMLAVYLSMTESHIRRLVEQERIPYTKVGPKSPGPDRRHLRFDRHAIDAWLAEQAVEAS